MLSLLMRRSRFVLAAFVLVLSASLPALAQEADHLTCFKIKDTSGIVVEQGVNVDLGVISPFGCQLKGKAKKYCYATTKDGGDDPRGGVVASFVCYKIKCPKDTLALVPFPESQFAAITGLAKTASGEICAPVSLAP